MPQMNPMLWLFLFIIFIITLLMVNPMIFFSKNFSSSTSSSLLPTSSLTWKW
uniref:ATP synthase complex subunit 8 n=1 Tax=Lachesilla punctata TaxID=2596988 RepID=A0A8K1ZFV2_9NEOP|nr:ATP synthase F0 subunit 8 [Lachesilla punctata]